MIQSHSIKFEWGVKIPLRDGVRLSAAVYAPRGMRTPAPTILTLTPYTADSYHEFGVYFAEHGLPFVIVDVRGRGASESVFRPFIQEARDGYDVVQWVAKQSYCDGQVAMSGSSYLGYCQWATAQERPPHLATIVPTAAPFMGVDFPMRSNIFTPYLIQWLTLTSGRSLQHRIFDDEGFWSKQYRRWHESGRPFRDIDTTLGNPSTVFQEWITHPRPDAYWDRYNPTAHQYSCIDIPILSITGSYDDDQPGALAHYRQHLRNASIEARKKHYLIIGPWNHAGTRSPAREFGGLQFGPASALDLRKLHLQWFAWTMQKGPKPAFLERSVAYYVMGAEQWRYADSIEDVTAYHREFFLDSASNANDVYASGSLGASVGKGGPDWYIFDPSETEGLEIEAEATTSRESLIDPSVAIALSGRALFYHSRPFERDTEISGFFKLSLWVGLDCPDTDLYVSVHEICLDGRSIRLSTDAIRARYRQGLRTEQLIRTAEPLQYEFERFTFISRRVKRGHRLRLIVAPMGRLIEGKFAEKNYNGGGVVAEESSNDSRAVTVRLFHDENHPSALSVPFG